jgi:hypothetical protein
LEIEDKEENNPDQPVETDVRQNNILQQAAISFNGLYCIATLAAMDETIISSLTHNVSIQSLPQNEQVGLQATF